MPVIPILQDDKNILPNQPGVAQVNTRGMGQDMAALYSVGGAAADLALKVIDARKKADDSDAVANAQHNDTLWIAKTEQDMRQTYNNPAGDAGAPAPNLQSQSDALPATTPALKPEVPINSRDPESDVSQPPQGQTSMIGGDAQLKYDPTGYAATLKKQMDDRFQENMKAMPSGEAQRMYRSIAQPMMDHTYLQNLDWENKTKAQTFIDNIGVRANRATEFLEKNPSIDAANNLLESMRQELTNASHGEGSVISPLDAEKFYVQKAREVAISTFTGYAQSASSAKAGLAILDSVEQNAPHDAKGNPVLRDESGSLKSMSIGGGPNTVAIGSVLHPTDLTAIRTHLSTVVEQEVKTNVAALENKIQSYHEVLMSGDQALIGQVFSPARAQQALAQIQQYAKDPKSGVTQDKANMMAMDMAMGVASNKVMSQLATLPPSEKAKADALLDSTFASTQRSLGITDPALGVKYKLQYDANKERLYSGLQKAQEQDPAGYIEAYFGKDKPPLGNAVPGQNRLAWRESMSKYMHIGNDSLLSDSERSKFQNSIDQAPNPDQAAAALMNIKNTTGSYSGRVFDEMTSGKGKLPDYYRTASMMMDKDSASAVISNSANKKALEESIDTADKKDLKDVVDKSFQKQYNSLASTGPFANNVSLAEGFKDQIKLEAINQMKTNPGMDQKEAVQNAQTKIFDNHFAIQSGALVPRAVGDTPINMNIIQGEMQKVFSDDWIASAKIKMAGADNPLLSAKLTRDAVMNGKWVTGPDQTSATFMVRQGTAWRPLPTENGPVKIDFKKATLNPSKEAVDYNTSFVSKVTKMITGE